MWEDKQWPSNGRAFTLWNTFLVTVFPFITDPAHASGLSVEVDVPEAGWMRISYDKLTQIYDPETRSGYTLQTGMLISDVYRNPQTHGRAYQVDTNLPDDGLWRVRPRGVPHGWTLTTDFVSTAVESTNITPRFSSLLRYAKLSELGSIQSGILYKTNGSAIGRIPRWCILEVNSSPPAPTYEIPNATITGVALFDADGIGATHHHRKRLHRQLQLVLRLVHEADSGRRHGRRRSHGRLLQPQRGQTLCQIHRKHQPERGTKRRQRIPVRQPPRAPRRGLVGWIRHLQRLDHRTSDAHRL